MDESSAWSIGLLRGPDITQLDADPARSNPILQARDVSDCDAGFVADPFALPLNGSWYLFFEVFDRRRGRGVIACAKSSDLITWSYLGVVLDEPYHLSYPYVFKVGSEIFMVPEGRKGGALRLYRAVDFPMRWKEERILLDGKYKDCSLVQHDGLWWIFAGKGAYSLQLFYAPTLVGPWKRHRKLFLCFHRKSKARPGGRVVHRNGKLIRFAQDNRLRYGHQLRVFEIDAINPRRYREHELLDRPILSPQGTGWNSLGMHHMDAWQLSDSSWIAFVDGEGPATI